jgi:AcrR family transcriptional regulator
MRKIDNGEDGKPDRRVRADARRNLDALTDAAKAVFAESGVDAPVREIAEKAGVGVGTFYRHFPQRSDLIVAVFRQEVDACAEAAAELAAKYDAGEAVERWLLRYLDYIAAKRGLASALHSGDPAYEALPDYFRRKLEPALRGLLDAAVAAGEMRGDVDAYDLLRAVGNLSTATGDGGAEHGRRMIALLVDGLRYRASPS